MLHGAMNLITLDDDTLIYILSFLDPSQLLLARTTCRRLCTLTHSRIVWTNACARYILERGCPFPNVPLDTLSVQELERHVCHSAKLATRWLSGSWDPIRIWSTAATANTSVTDVRLVPGSQGALLLTLSKSVWSAVTIWQLEPVTSRVTGEACSFLKRCEWSPRGAIFSGFCLNSDPSAEIKLAISMLNAGKKTIELLALDVLDEPSNWSFRSVMSFPTTFKPINLEGDLLAMSDSLGETVVFNCKTREYATLEQPQEVDGVLLHDNCIHVVFTSHCILVVRARSLCLFPFPTLKGHDEEPLRYLPIARHSFGWVDGVSVKITGKHQTLATSNDQPLQPLSILVRTETDDPWASDMLSIDLYTLHPNTDYTAPDSSSGESKVPTQIHDMTSSSAASAAVPYLFPPILTSRVPSRRGALRCTDIRSGRLGTAFWVQPRDRGATGLYWLTDDAPSGPETYLFQEHRHESLVATVFPGSLFQGRNNENDAKKSGSSTSEQVTESEGTVICLNEQNNWSSIDYDEDVGRIVLGTSFGKITILDL